MGSIDHIPNDLNGINGHGKPQAYQEIHDRFAELYAENITAKILRTATKHLEGNASIIILSREGTSLQAIESPPWSTPRWYPKMVTALGTIGPAPLTSGLAGSFLAAYTPFLSDSSSTPALGALGKTWSDPIHGESRLTNTHDMGFIMMPHMRPRWELFHDEKALQSIITSARNLATRFSSAVGAIRSWDEDIWSLVTSGKGKPGNYIVIIDSMCNLDLLFYASAQTGDLLLAQVAETHARTLLSSHIRREPKLSRHGFEGMLYSTGHVANFSSTGEVVERLTAQGHSATSTWSRGQAWAILGYAQTYMWTKKREFLDVACGLAEYFLLKLETAPACVEVDFRGPNGTLRKIGRYVPMWDFAAPPDEFSPPLRDSSAGVCAANGLLVLSQALASKDKSLSWRYLESALAIVEDTLAYSLSQDKAELKTSDGQLIGVDSVYGRTFESILRNSTVSNNPAGMAQIRDHGLVYADYYLIEFGTRLLRMGLS
ncbi:hypothetical protein NM208_g2226 [Fusarium decemcellulare]|uniref:Uncharacterized protein n=1 Tax=Fusarium decemcellulare TaxID=57161 RepID=A0ACC1STQ0_9HYPO|nr:hypothetical protein NM208_g2226 [Fusarium decemcellulare]